MLYKHLKDLKSEKGLERSVDKFLFRAKQVFYEKKERKGNGGSQDIAHVTYGVATNVGDTVLSKCVRMTFNTALQCSGWRLIPVAHPVTEKTIETINECGRLVIGGGGLFLPDTNKNLKSGWQWAISSDQLKSIKVPVNVFSVGYNYFRGQESNRLFMDSLCTLVDKSSFFGLRNMGSVKAIKAMLPQELSEKVSFQPCTTTLIRKLYSSELEWKIETNSVAINMAFDREELRFGNKKETVLNNVAKAVKMIENKGYKIYYICHCWDDEKFLQYLRAAGVRYTLADFSHRYPSQLIDFYNNMDVVLGMRGHAQMIPFGLNCEIISLGTHDKMKWFLDDINAEDWYIDLMEEPEELDGKILDIFTSVHEQHKSDTKERLLKEQDRLWSITQQNLEQVSR